MRLLIAEPGPLDGHLLKRALEAAGHEVLGPVSTPGEALSLAHTRSPELALVDVRLGDREGGRLATRLFEQSGLASLHVGEAPATEPTLVDASRSAADPWPLLGDLELAAALLRHIAGSPSAQA